ncbi:MAG: methylated-DNA--[protein]-cysteine S-methyltransferase [Pseudomonadota bacterium]
MSTQYGYMQHEACTLFGIMRLSGAAGVLTSLDFGVEHLGAQSEESWMQQATAWLHAYCAGNNFSGQTTSSPPALQPGGSAFQRKVWAVLQQIPLGETITYAELARRAGSAPRAVGGALRANPLPIFIPCHRVLAAHGLGGYCGASELGRQRKLWLLEHEARMSRRT